jgi:hypothetical protein
MIELRQVPILGYWSLKIGNNIFRSWNLKTAERVLRKYNKKVNNGKC